MNNVRQISATKAENLEITPTQQVVITAILAGSSVVEACENANVNRATFYRWQSNDPAFLAELNKQRAELNESIRNGLLSLAREAVDTLGTVMRDANQPGATRVKAASAVLERIDRNPRQDGPTTVQKAIEKQVMEFVTSMIG